MQQNETDVKAAALAGLVCPTDHSTLRRLECLDGLRCTLCGHEFPIEEGVVRFVPQHDTFYEGAYDNRIKFLPKSEKWFDVWPLWLINSGYIWQIRKHVPAGSRILELGCAGGVSYLGRRFRAVGCDLSHSALVDAAKIYDVCFQADAGTFIPLPDGSLDAVVSSYFWEHIPPDTKPKILAECHRILRPEGKLVFLYDVATHNPLIRSLKRQDPGLYQRLFIDKDGHLGYESAEDNMRLFEGSGFRVVAQRGLEITWVQSPSVYEKLRHGRGAIASVSRILYAISTSRAFHLHNAVVRLVDETIGRWFPSSWARVAITVCEKTDRHSR